MYNNKPSFKAYIRYADSRSGIIECKKAGFNYIEKNKSRNLTISLFIILGLSLLVNAIYFGIINPDAPKTLTTLLFEIILVVALIYTSMIIRYYLVKFDRFDIAEMKDSQKSK